MKITKILTYTVLTLLAVIFIVPFIWLVVESLSPVNNIGFVIPSHFTLAPFYKVLTNHEFMNSIYEGLIMRIQENQLEIKCLIANKVLI